MLFMEQLPAILSSLSRVRRAIQSSLTSGADHLPRKTLLVITSISCLFSSAELTLAHRSSLLQRVKQLLANLTLDGKLTVRPYPLFLPSMRFNGLQIVITSQLATKMVNPDGSPGTFDSGVVGIMVPQLGQLNYAPCHIRHLYSGVDRSRLPPDWEDNENYILGRQPNLRVRTFPRIIS